MVKWLLPVIYSYAALAANRIPARVDQQLWLLSINRSIKQINQSNFYSANIPGRARLSGLTAESVFNSKIDETVPCHQQAIRCAGVQEGKAKSKRYVFRCSLKVATEMAEWTASERLFHRDRAQEWKGLASVLVLTLGTYRLIPWLHLREWDRSDGASIEWR